MSSFKLLSVSADAKTIKGEKKGYLTGILYLAPANLSGHEVCASRSAGCTQACLNTAGRAGIFPKIIEARIRKTRELFANREAFIEQLTSDIFALERKANRLSLIPCVRINGTSDLPWLANKLAERFPDIQFYDYTKHAKPWERTRDNYHLTFSQSETNYQECVEALAHGINVAVVFPIRKGKPLPESLLGRPVLNGDTSDLRFTDPVACMNPADGKLLRGCIVGLRAKGRAKHDNTGFVLGPELHTIAPMPGCKCGSKYGFHKDGCPKSLVYA